MTRKIDRSRSKEREKHKGDPNDRSTLRIDFARAKMKMSGHNVLTQSQGKVRRNQSLLLVRSAADAVKSVISATSGCLIESLY
ncbi:hypothetical protein CFP56_040437 [Quercus suber]|uniref:Uncharacterized protein n=1 Tax=Quercus suber TaxID=58331 RepID=A0AAW0IYZ2_QUESU